MASRDRSLAKLTPPTLPRLLDRPRLFRALDRARVRPVVWLSGPAGSGKTTLVASYFKDRGVPLLWYQLDAGDADPATLFHYLGLALEQMSPQSTPLPHMTPDYVAGLEIFSRRFFEELFARLPSKATLVFDNFQELPAGAASHRVLAIGLSVIPRQRGAIVMSRGAPHRALGRLRAERKVSVIEEGQLDLTADETKRLARMQLGGRVAPAIQELERLHRRTRGWMTGAVLLLSRGSGTLAGLEARAPPPQVLFDYLMAEVLERFDDDTQTVLLRTSVVPSMSVATARALSGRERAGDVLASLHRDRYFTERRPGADSTYQYHPLFREFLVAETARRYSHGEILELRHAAAVACEAAGLIDDAGALYKEAAAFDELARLVIANAGRLLRDGRARTVESWLDALPATQHEQQPWLGYWGAVCRLGVNPVEARAGFSDAFERFRRSGDRAGELLAWCGIVDAIWYAWNDLPAIDRWIDEFATLSPDATDYPSALIEAAVTCAMFNALFWRRPSGAGRWAERATAVLEGLPALGAEHAVTAIALINFYVLVGDLDRAEHVAKILEAAVLHGPVAAAVEVARYQAEAAVAVVLGDADRCLRAAAKGLELARSSGALLWTLPLVGVACLGALSIGDVEAAKQHSERMLARELGGALSFRSWALTLTCRVRLEEGDIQGAARAAQSSLRLTLREGPFPEVLSRLAVTYASLAAGRRAEARRQLTHIEAMMSSMRAPLLELGWRLAAAQLAFDDEDEQEGLRNLRLAFGVGASSGIMEWQGGVRAADLARLCTRALQAGIETDYVRALIKRRRLAADVGVAESWPWPIKIYTLGRFTLLRDGQPVVFRGKAQNRPLDLLKVMVAFGGRDVSRARVIEALWPDADGDAAIAAMNMALKRLRELLGHATAVALVGRKLTLDPRWCWVDVWAFERSLGESGTMAADDDSGLGLYRGPFLGAEEAPWTQPLRERLRVKALGRVRRLAKHHEDRREWVEAIRCYERGLAIDDLTEEFYQRLMLCHEQLGQRGEALSVYRRCKRCLAVQPSLIPSSKTERIFAQVTGRAG